MRLRLAAIAVLVLALCGCGTTGKERDAQGSVQRFIAALSRHDGAAACDELSPDAVSAVEQGEKKACGKAILSLGLPAAPVADVQVYIDSAQAKLRGGAAVFLEETPKGWKVSAAGCKPQPGMPYQCELEA
ncbi:MAG TPA: hypothetical protein VKB17_01745 [Thermoleophilaceae bacterium]|nr:hypothetical protein [Thermoleophilaceae bacterium]